MIPVRTATPGDLPLLGPVERAADSVFEPLGIVFPPGSVIDEVTDPTKVRVVGDPPVAFAYADWLDSRLHLHQIAVHPSYARQGIGSALMGRVISVAGNAGVTLTTFRDVPWNGPWYRKLGFREIHELGPGLAALVEAERGLTDLGPRVAMYRNST
jgi:GNAT superfamily N-acetyltransferase